MLTIIGTFKARLARATASLSFVVKDALHADGGEHDGRGEFEPQERYAHVAMRHIAEQPRHDPPAAECVAIGAHGVFRAGAPRQITERRGLEHGPGRELQLVDGDRLCGTLTGDSRLVDLHLAAQAPRGSGIRFRIHFRHCRPFFAREPSIERYE